MVGDALRRRPSPSTFSRKRWTSSPSARTISSNTRSRSIRQRPRRAPLRAVPSRDPPPAPDHRGAAMRASGSASAARWPAITLTPAPARPRRRRDLDRPVHGAAHEKRDSLRALRRPAPPVASAPQTPHRRGSTRPRHRVRAEAPHGSEDLLVRGARGRDLACAGRSPRADAARLTPPSRRPL